MTKVQTVDRILASGKISSNDPVGLRKLDGQLVRERTEAGAVAESNGKGDASTAIKPEGE